MDPFTFGLLVFVSGSAAAALGLRTGRQRARRDPPPSPPRRLTGGDRENSSTASSRPATGQGGFRAGDVITHLGDTFWLAGELALVRDGATVLRLFSAPDKGHDRWIAVPRDDASVWVLDASPALASLGWPGVEVPLGSRLFRRGEHGPVAVMAAGEHVEGWEGMGRVALFAATGAVALVLEGPGGKLALTGEEIPRALVQKMG